VSAVWWSLFAISFTLLFSTDLNNSEFTPLMPIVAYALHLATCWVMERFLGDRN
jgi:hypothetical protein